MKNLKVQFFDNADTAVELLNKKREKYWAKQSSKKRFEAMNFIMANMVKMMGLKKNEIGIDKTKFKLTKPEK